MFNRSAYYSQTDVVKKYQISVKQYKTLLKEKNIPVVSKHISLGTFDVNTVYVLREDIDRLNLPIRHK